MEVLSQVRKIREEADDAILHQGAPDTDAAFMLKPLTMETVARKVGHVLDS
jgi:hypothetical protein